MYCILLVEDDEDLQNIIQIYLRKSGYAVDGALRGSDALDMMDRREYDLVLMDIMLPDENGDIICRKIRTFSDVPIIFISCLSDEDIVVRAFSYGGDDYVVKPINQKLLLARISANIRRYKATLPKAQSDIIKMNKFSVNTSHRTVSFGNSVFALSQIEYAILMYFMDNPDRLLLYNDIYKAVWSRESFGDFRTVMVHVSNVRKKIGDDAGNIICTIRGAGYIFSNI